MNTYLLLLLLVICVATDVKSRKIYNAVLLPFFAVALIVQVSTGGADGLAAAALGTVSGFVILLIPYLLGGMGAGDVKLLAVIGTLMGPGFVLMSALYMALVGGILAVLVILFRTGAKQRLIGISYFLHGLRTGVKIPLFQEEGAMKATYPYGLAIAAGAVIQSLQAGGVFL